MNPYYQGPSVIAPYLVPLIQVNPLGAINCNSTPQYGAWLQSPDNQRNAMLYTPPPTPPTFTQPSAPYQPPAVHFSQLPQPNGPAPQSLPPVTQAVYHPSQLPQPYGPALQPSTSAMPNLASASGSLKSCIRGIHHQPPDLPLQKYLVENDDNSRKITDIEDLLDANFAGSERSLECSLLLTEGSATMSLAMAALSPMHRNIYGLYAVKRRPINVSKLPEVDVKNNSDVKNITNILGLRFECTYETDEELRTLRYGRVILMMDRDEEGSHMKGLIINLFYKFWPSLIHGNTFLMQFISPAVKVWYREYPDNARSFYTVEDYKNWMADKTSETDKFITRHYKSLESFTACEMKAYFLNLVENCIFFRYENQEDDKALKLAFEKGREDLRKEWISNMMRESFVYCEDLREIRYKDFVNKELLFYNDLQNVRSFPSAIDGLTRSQRKVLHACFKKPPGQEISVLRLMGSVLDISMYKQDMDSLGQTIIKMAQDFVGTNNINILMPIGQFGTRIYGGKDAGKPKYLYTKLNSVMSHIFSELDFPLLTYREEDNMSIEPIHYVPIIPMILVNGSDGIGTGWITKIPKYNPEDIIKNLFRMLNDLEPEEMKPYFKNFKGLTQKIDDNQFNSCGKILKERSLVRITELPIGFWTEDFKKDVLNPLVDKNILHYEEYHTDTSVDFLVSLHKQEHQAISEEELYNMFNLKKNKKAYYVAFNYRGVVKNFENPTNILDEYFDVRLSAYEKRKEFLLNKLEFNLKVLEDLYEKIKYTDSTLIRYNLERQNLIYDPRQIQPEQIITLKKDISKTKEKIRWFTEKSPRDLWRKDLLELCSKLGIDVPESWGVHENLIDTELIPSMLNFHL